MDTFFVLADTNIRSTSYRDVAFSARPDAPVLPYVQPRHRMRRLVGAAQALRRSSPSTRRPNEVGCGGPVSAGTVT